MSIINVRFDRQANTVVLRNLLPLPQANTAALYIWTNTHTFSSNVTIVGNTTSVLSMGSNTANIIANSTAITVSANSAQSLSINAVSFFVGNSSVYTTANQTAINTSSISATSYVKAYTGTAIPAGGTTGSGVRLSSTANFGVFFGSGVPTLSAGKGSIYLRSDGSGTNNRMYINTDGATTWTAVVTVV